MVKRVERKHVSFGGTWEEVMRLTQRIKTGSFDPKARALETVWRNPATPTKAQQADATVKLYAAGITPLEQARIDLGYTPAQRLEMRRMDDEAATGDPLVQIGRDLMNGTGNAAAGG